MNPFFTILFVTALFASLGLEFAGAIMARRAYRAHGWPEARLASRALAGMAVLFIVGSVTLPLIGWLGGSIGNLDILYAVSAGYSIAGAALSILLAVALYRLARRAANSRIAIEADPIRVGSQG